VGKAEGVLAVGHRENAGIALECRDLTEAAVEAAVEAAGEVWLLAGAAVFFGGGAGL